MNGRLYILVFAFVSIFFQLYGQDTIVTKKQVAAKRVADAPKIDGILDDTCWIGVQVATDFVRVNPDNGGSARKKSEVKFVYNDDALYVGAMLYDDPDSIRMLMTGRDDFAGDYFGVYILPFNDNSNSFDFFVTSCGAQSENYHTQNGQDWTWNAVWKSAVKINDKGWAVEMKIPYSAIRFSKIDKQTWGLNIFRSIHRFGGEDSWSFIDYKKGGGYLTYCGELTGIEDVTPPLRLSFTPYLSAYLLKDPGVDELGYSFNGGMDLKYGINESFTLDMTLIPDFGQVQSDDQVLNLSPFETYYGEQRPFFTENTALFNKQGIFYSRRIGSAPAGYFDMEDSLKAGETISTNPSETRLYNAAKISGRTSKGTALGFFNAVTAASHATLTDSLGNTRQVMTQPVTNYNILVIDQRLKNNSSIGLINTNVLNKIDGYIPNVTAAELDLKNKKNSYGLRLGGNLCQKYYDNDTTEFGHFFSLNFNKMSGNFRFMVSASAMNETYDDNDMGFTGNNNFTNLSTGISYHTFNPVWRFLGTNTNLTFNYMTLYNMADFSGMVFNFHTDATFKNQWSSHINASFNPLPDRDYYEPRTDGRFVIEIPKAAHIGGWIFTDYRKKLSASLNLGTRQAIGMDQSNYWGNIGPSLSLGARFKLNYNFSFNYMFNDRGWVTDYNDSIYFGNRDVITIANTFSGSFVFNPNSLLTIRLRHYWQSVDYDYYLVLKDDGYLINAPEFDALVLSDIGPEGFDINFNTFTIDLMYIWNFAPGSEMTVVWKNYFLDGNSLIVPKYMDNFDNSVSRLLVDHSNSLSVKIIYYLDYQYLKFRK